MLATLALTAGVLGPTAGGAHAVDPSKGAPGFCTTDTGVTVVVDFQELGGTTLVRCFPDSTEGTGLDALKGAGLQIEGVQRWGESFICRIENRPSASETIPIEGNSGYREACVDTPPASAYWSYWYAGNNCAWEYSQWGVKNRDFIPGGFEGWSFSLNATADSNPEPRIAAVRPGTEGEACQARKEPPPTSNDPNERQSPQRSGSDPSGGGARNDAASDPGAPNAPGSEGGADGGDFEGSGGTRAERDAQGELPPPRPRDEAADRSEAADPARNVTFTDGETSPDVNDLLKEDSAASDYAPWAAGGAVVVLGGATWLTARRRRRARQG